MVFLRTGVTAALTAFTLLTSTIATPLAEKLTTLSPDARHLLKRSVPAAPRFVVYDDAWVNPLPTPSELKGFNVYALSFWLTAGAADMALAWEQLTDSQRTSYLKEYNNAGISIIVSAFGATDIPTTSGADATTVAQNLAAWVRKYRLQGVDIDYEDLNAFEVAHTAEEWLITLTKELRKHLPQGQYSLSHAPIAPWFSPTMWSGGGYLKIHKSVGNLIDWYNLQYYSQGKEYTTCHGLITASSSQYPETALFQIAANGVDENKLVIGKPAQPSDAGSGYMDLGKLAWCVGKAHAAGWDAGVMVWEYPDAPSSWITTVRGHTF